jgi:hypothetical protein
MRTAHSIPSLTSKPRPLARAVRWALLLGATLCLAGCASLRPDAPTQVRQLATERWQALLAGQHEKAYEMAVPSYRKLKTLDDYRFNLMSLPVRWKSAQVLRADCEEKRCKVTVRVVSELRMPGRFRGDLDSAMDEIWVFEDGQWWMFETR